MIFFDYDWNDVVAYNWIGEAANGNLCLFVDTLKGASLQLCSTLSEISSCKFKELPLSQ